MPKGWDLLFGLTGLPMGTPMAFHDVECLSCSNFPGVLSWFFWGEITGYGTQEKEDLWLLEVEEKTESPGSEVGI